MAVIENDFYYGSHNLRGLQCSNLLSRIVRVARITHPLSQAYSILLSKAERESLKDELVDLIPHENPTIQRLSESWRKDFLFQDSV